MDVGTLAELLHETAEHHDQYEKTHAAHNWWDWYAAYIGLMNLLVRCGRMFGGGRVSGGHD